jgi:hypothetical protein
MGGNRDGCNGTRHQAPSKLPVSDCMSLKVVFNACSSVLALEEGSHAHEQNSKSGWSLMSL